MSHQSNHLNTQFITFVYNLYTNKNFINFSYQSTSQRYQNNIYGKKNLQSIYRKLSKEILKFPLWSKWFKKRNFKKMFSRICDVKLQNIILKCMPSIKSIDGNSS